VREPDWREPGLEPPRPRQREDPVDLRAVAVAARVI
jgi:hypothetical protein